MQWDQFNFIKPVKGVDSPEDIQALAEAEATIGDYKLKSDPLYKPPKHLRMTTVKKYKQFFEARQQVILNNTNFMIGNRIRNRLILYL